MINLKHELLLNNLNLEQAEQLQIKYSSILKSQEIEIKDSFSINELNYVVGVDISYFKQENKEFGVSCAVLWDIPNKEMKYSAFIKGQVRFPYHPGFLGFRECNLIAQAIKKLPTKPDIIICDGHGIIHPKRFGEAVHLGLALNIPSIGIAKEPFIGYSNWIDLKRKKANKVPIFASDPLVIKNSESELLGYAVCLNDNMKPVFISRGYKTTLDLAIDIALKTTLSHRQPEPLYLADRLSKKKVEEFA